MTSGPFDAIQAPVRDLHEMASWPGTVINYAQSTTDSGDWFDDTGGSDEGWTDDDGESVPIRVDTGTAPEVIRTAGGREVTGDATIYVDPTDHPGGRDGFANGSGDEEKATEIVDEDSGERYQVVRVLDEHSGILILECDLLT